MISSTEPLNWTHWNHARSALKVLRATAVILTLVTAVIHFRFAFGRFTPLSIAFAVMGIIYVVAAVAILLGKTRFYKLALVYTVVLVLTYFLALLQPLPPFTQSPFHAGTLPIVCKAVEVILIAVLGIMTGKSMK